MFKNHSYPVLGKRNIDFAPEYWVNATPAGTKLRAAATEANAKLQKDPDYLSTFLRGFALGSAAGALGELLSGLTIELGAEDATAVLADCLATGSGSFASGHLLRGSHKLLPLFLEPERKEFTVDSDSWVGRSVSGWTAALKSLLEREFGQDSVTVVQEVCPIALPCDAATGRRFGAFDVFVAVHTLGHAVALEIDEPYSAVNPDKLLHTSKAQKDWDDRKDQAAADIGLPVLRLAESQLSNNPRAAMGLCLKFLQDRTGLEVTDRLYNQYNWKGLQKLPRFTANSGDQRVPSGWRPAF